MKKKLLALTLAALMALSLAACGGDTADSADTETESTETESTDASGETYTVGICQLMVHDSLDQATQGFTDALTDRMEEALQTELDGRRWRHTNRFSPGYCGWHVSEQQRLFRLFGTESPCGVSLTDSSLMVPIKSVSGVIGLGPEVRKLEYSCGLCDYKDCYKRRK